MEGYARREGEAERTEGGRTHETGTSWTMSPESGMPNNAHVIATTHTSTAVVPDPFQNCSFQVGRCTLQKPT